MFSIILSTTVRSDIVFLSPTTVYIVYFYANSSFCASRDWPGGEFSQDLIYGTIAAVSSFYSWYVTFLVSHANSSNLKIKPFKCNNIYCAITGKPLGRKGPQSGSNFKEKRCQQTRKGHINMYECAYCDPRKSFQSTWEGVNPYFSKG